MGFSNSAVKQGYVGNGSNVNFAIPFAYFVETEVQVYRRDITAPLVPVITLLTVGISNDYTLTGSSPPTTPLSTTVTFNVAPTSNHQIFVVRKLPLTQIDSFIDTGGFSPLTMEVAINRLCAEIQQQNEQIRRAIFFNLTSALVDIEMPDIVASGFLRANPAGTGFIWATLAQLGGGFGFLGLPTDGTYGGGTVTAGIAQGDRVEDAFDKVETYFATVASNSFTKFTLVNNQSAVANITGLLLDATKYLAATVDYYIYRATTSTGASELIESGSLKAMFKTNAATWALYENPISGDDSGVTFSIVTATGQVQYQSSNQSGTYAAGTSFIKFQIKGMGL